MKCSDFLAGVMTIAFLLTSASVLGDILEMKDGIVLLNCYVRDEGVRLLVWENLDKAGTPDFRIDTSFCFLLSFQAITKKCGLD